VTTLPVIATGAKHNTIDYRQFSGRVKPKIKIFSLKGFSDEQKKKKTTDAEVAMAVITQDPEHQSQALLSLYLVVR
jgi:hypothetical protein